MKTEKINSLSYMRAIACLGVVFIHTLTQGISIFNGSAGGAVIAYWSVLNNLKWSVPVFFMVTGMLLLDPAREITYKKLFSGYIVRALKALVTFVIIYTICNTVIAAGPDKAATFLKGIGGIFTGQTWSHMWYLYAIIGIYLLLPVYRMIAEKAKKRDMEYLLIVYAVFLSVITLINTKVQLAFYIHVSSIYPFWIFFGYYLKKWGFKRRTSFYLLCTLVSVVVLVVLTVIRWKADVSVLDRMFNYSSFVVMLQTYGITGLMTKMKPASGGAADKALLAGDKYSFGIYLIHMIFIWLFFVCVKFDPFLHGGFFGILLIGLVSYAAGFVLCVLLKKAPHFRTFL